jgi:hypothetical protein
MRSNQDGDAFPKPAAGSMLDLFRRDVKMKTTLEFWGGMV